MIDNSTFNRSNETIFNGIGNKDIPGKDCFDKKILKILHALHNH